MALTPKQARFASEYLIDLNATQAAARAGYKDPNIGRQLITKDNVAKAIQSAIQAREKRAGVTQDQVVKELSQVAFAQAADCSASELKYASKLKALELLGKHLGMFDGKGGGEPDRETGVALLPEVREV